MKGRGNMSTDTLPKRREGYFPHWKLKTTGVIMPEERLPWGQTIVSGMQHGVAEFLTKPINRVELYARVRAQLHILELGRQLERVEKNLGGANAPRPPAGR